MVDFLLELLSEEIPARMQRRAADLLKTTLVARLAEAHLPAAEAEAFVTPRRLTVILRGLPEAQPDRTVEVRGPRVGAPPQAIEGFLRANNLASLDQCDTRDTGKGVFHIAVTAIAGKDAAAVLADLVPDVLDGFVWPKSMRWGDHAVRWVRPLQNILALLEENGAARIVPVIWRLDRGPGEADGRVIAANDRTRGHRFLAPDWFTVTGIADYREKLKNAKVILDLDDRKALIAADAEALAVAQGLDVIPDPDLLEEVAGLVEWPVVRLGRIDPAFMDVPAEVLTTSMRTHQKYFALENAAGALAPFFIVVCNNLPRDGGAVMVAGNERVLKARLSDAKFFWDQDRKATLESRLGRLKERVFHAKLGTVSDKVDRMRGLSARLCPVVERAIVSRFDLPTLRNAADRAAQLAKADLSSALVGEFPELQGIVGRYLLREENRALSGDQAVVGDAIAQAIAEHYAPAGLDDQTPIEPVSVVVSLADKLDTLICFFAIDEKPTGSKDPYALRRAALGIIRLVLTHGLRLPLRAFFTGVLADQSQLDRSPKVVDGLIDFFAERLKTHLKDLGIRHDIVAAVLAVGAWDGDLVLLVARARALQDFLTGEDGANLLTAYRRASKIVAIEEKKDNTTYNRNVDPAVLLLPEESALFARLTEVAPIVHDAVGREEFGEAMTVLAQLRGPVDGFFDRVTVNADDPTMRANRLCLLAQIRDTLNRVADFSRIEG